MILKVQVDDQLIDLNVPGDFIARAGDFFDSMDRDMDRGWQVNREWVEQPDQMLRAQIAANKLFTALENEDDKLGRLMAGYIVARVPQVSLVELNPMGEVRDHVIHTESGRIEAEDEGPFSHEGLPAGLSGDAAGAQAARDVSKVFKMGRQYRFTVFNHATGSWDESPAFGSEDAAAALRDRTIERRRNALLASS